MLGSVQPCGTTSPACGCESVGWRPQAAQRLPVVLTLLRSQLVLEGLDLLGCPLLELQKQLDVDPGDVGLGS